MIGKFDNRFAEEFPELSAHQPAAPLTDPQVVIANQQLLTDLGLPASGDELAWFAGGVKPLPGSQPLAQKYAGHQFGHYNPYLGDGRGLLLGEVKLPESSQVLPFSRYDLHLKGAGPTPFSRSGDGRAVLRSSIREFLASEALYHLNVPTTRALSVVAGADVAYREQPEPAAMLVRLARTHIRFGHFEHCYHRGLADSLARLKNYVIDTQWPDLAQSEPAAFFARIVSTTASMIARWQAMGFAHGVMNTDNMSIVGETFDFGPYQFMDRYQPKLICNHTDTTGRYAFDQQPSIGLWNLNCLALALSPLIESDALVAELKAYQPQLEAEYWRFLAGRMGLQSENTEHRQLMQRWLGILASEGLDYSLSFRSLAKAGEEGLDDLLSQVTDRASLAAWWQMYQRQLGAHAVDSQLATQLKQKNPLYLVRNHLAQRAIVAAEQGDLSVLQQLYAAIQQPFTEQSDFAELAQPPTSAEEHLEISCSS